MSFLRSLGLFNGCSCSSNKKNISASKKREMELDELTKEVDARYAEQKSMSPIINRLAGMMQTTADVAWGAKDRVLDLAGSAKNKVVDLAGYGDEPAKSKAKKAEKNSSKDTKAVTAKSKETTQPKSAAPASNASWSWSPWGLWSYWTGGAPAEPAPTIDVSKQKQLTGVRVGK